MTTHYTAHVKISATTPEERDQYDKVKHPREVKDLTEFTVRANSESELATKINSILDGALDYGKGPVSGVRLSEEVLRNR